MEHFLQSVLPGAVNNLMEIPSGLTSDAPCGRTPTSPGPCSCDYFLPAFKDRRTPILQPRVPLRRAVRPTELGLASSGTQSIRIDKGNDSTRKVGIDLHRASMETTEPQWSWRQPTYMSTTPRVIKTPLGW